MASSARRAPLLVATVLAGALGLAGCTAYQPVAREPGQSWADARAAARRAAAPPVAERAAGRMHRVQPGDSVGRLAQRYEVPVREIIAANRLAKPYTLEIGRTLVIPGRPAGPPPLPAPEAPATVAQDRAAREAAAAAAAQDRPARETAEVRVASLDPPSAPTPSAPAASRPPAEPPRGPTSLAGPQAGAIARAGLPEPDAATLRRAQEATPPPLTGEGFLQPVEGRVLSGFGDKPDGRRNDGINLAAPRGTPVKAAENGIVVYAGDSIPGFGRLLLIRHADGFTTAYGHLEQVLVAVGDRVERGRIVARVGDTGDVKTAQLHFQLRNGRTPIDPRPHLVGAGLQVAARPAGRAPGG